VMAPGGAKKKKVKTGADIACAGGVLYATKGNNSLEFWCYGLPLTQPRPAPGGVMSEASAPQRAASLLVTPNPARSGATIRYTLPRTGRASLKLFDVTGSLVATLFDASVPAGEHTSRVNAAGLARGIYLVKLEADGFKVTRKLILE